MKLGFDYDSFKLALKRVEEEKYDELKRDISKVKMFFEKMITLSLESSASMAQAEYKGIEL